MGSAQYQSQNSNESKNTQIDSNFNAIAISKRNNLIIGKYSLQLHDRDIVLDYKNKIKLVIGDVISFPSGYEGLHLWDSNIVLARFILKNKSLFYKKTIIQFNSGTGIGAITVAKYCDAQKVIASDKNEQVILNIDKNISKNSIQNKLMTALIKQEDLLKKESKIKFDFVLGADLIYKGCSNQRLIYVLYKILKTNGKAIIIVDGQSNKQSITEFINKLDKNIFTVKKQKLQEQIYMQSPLLNQVQGLQQFPRIQTGYFLALVLQKIKQVQAEYQKVLLKDYYNLKSRMSEHNENTNETANNDLKIKQEHLQPTTHQKQKQKQSHLNKQLEVVTISKNCDRPQYERNKRKSITQLIAQSEDKHKQQIKNVHQANNNQIQIDKNDVQQVKKQHLLFEHPAKKQQDQPQSNHKGNMKA